MYNDNGTFRLCTFYTLVKWLQRWFITEETNECFAGRKYPGFSIRDTSCEIDLLITVYSRPFGTNLKLSPPPRLKLCFTVIYHLLFSSNFRGNKVSRERFKRERERETWMIKSSRGITDTRKRGFDRGFTRSG